MISGGVIQIPINMGQNVQQNTTSTTPATPSGGGVQTISLPGNSGNNPGIIMVSMTEKILTITLNHTWFKS